jgi:cell division protein FtsB
VELENYMGQLGKEETMLKTKIKDYETTNNELDNKIQEIAFDISEMSAIIK